MAAATPREGVKSQARASTWPGDGVLSRALALGLLAAAFAGACGPPTVDARAVWIASQRGSGGARTLSIYDAGLLTARQLSPADPGPAAGAQPLIVELDPRGQGALVRAADSGWQHELGDSTGTLRAGFIDIAGERTLPLALPAGQAPTAATFATAGGALWWFDGCPAALKLVPLSPQVALETAGEPGAPAVVPLTWPLPGGCAETWGAVSAADAPVLFVLDGLPAAGSLWPGPNGHVLAIRYPAPTRGRDDAPALAVLRGARLPAGPFERLPRAACTTPHPSCGLGVVDPDGHAISFAGAVDGPCRVWRWSLTDPAPVCAIPATAPAWAEPTRLIAAITPTRYVFRDGLVIRRYDWVTGEHDGRPLLGDTSELFTRVSADGRALVFLTVRGAVLRVDDLGLELLSAEQAPCPAFQAPVLSPAARFVAWTCTSLPEEGDQGLVAGEVVRVSAAGMERFTGVPMWALAIDDDGDLLLHSRDDPSISPELSLPAIAPRNLYVLSGDGELARIDALEPDPELMRGASETVHRWIAAQPL